MSLNNNLNKAKQEKNDEFYTLLSDIEKELKNYKQHFEGKTVYCNCDDPVESNFWVYFDMNFDLLKLKSLVSTHYDTENEAYKLELKRDENGNKIGPFKTIIGGNGDFRSKESIEILKQSDIVVTNPPFSLFRSYVDQLMEYNKKFLIIGSMNAIKYKEVFPLIKNNEIWLGCNNVKEFLQPDGTIKKFGNICWFTNLEHFKRNEELILFEKYYDYYDKETGELKPYKENKYPKYDNYNAINVNSTADIPYDFDGIMGVPITFMDKYCPEQFDILGLSIGSLFDGNALGTNFMELYRSQGGTGHYSENMIGLGLIDIDGKAKVPYGRILIRNKHPEKAKGGKL